jgi:uncharacterized protein (TIGR02217 family)
MTQPYLPSRWLVTTAFGTADPDVFPLLPGQVFITRKSPTWSTDIKQANSGRERRRMNWSYPLWNFQVQYEVLRDAPGTPELQGLIAFFNAHAGRYQEFFYFDPSDHAVTDQVIGIGDGVKTTFQLTRTITDGTFTFTEPVFSVQGSPVFKVAGVPTAATVGAYGQITFASAPSAAASISWTGNFMFLCRFDQDNLDLQQMMQGLWSQSGLAFVSSKR